MIPIRLSSLLAFALLASCAPRPGTVPKHVPLDPPPRARAVEVAPVRQAAAAASREGAVAGAKVEQIAAEVKALETHLDAAVAEADRLRKQKSASERELDLMWENLTKIHQRHDALSLEAQGAKAALDRQKLLHAAAETEIAKLEQAVRAAGVEVALLRSSFTTAEKLRAGTAEALDTANASAAAHLTKAQKLSGEVRVFRILAGTLLLAALAWFLVPLLKRTLIP